jgi:DsbC/DsbD-like thiol-disulfide interchange protein
MIARVIHTVLLIALGAMPLRAQSSMEHILSHRVIAGWTQADGTRLAALELTLAPGWKTYWRAPGDAGIPPEFTWRGARNLSAVHVHWPAPMVFWQSGMRSVGYKDKVVLPLSVVPRDQGQDVRLKGRVDLGICSDICVPASIDIDAVVPAAQQDRSPSIVAALATLPLSAREAGVTSTVCRLTPTASGMKIEARVTVPPIGGDEDAVIEASAPGIWVSEAEVDRAGESLIVTAELIGQTQGPLVVDRSRLRITLIGTGNAVDIRGCTG